MKNIIGIHKICGIYCIKNVISGKEYIGSSVYVYFRIKRHLSDLRKNRHSSKQMQNSFNKHGEDKFVTQILEVCTPHKLLEKEKHWIEVKKPYFNTFKNPVRPSLPEKSREKISKSLKIKYKSGMKSYDHPDKKIWVELFDMSGRFIKRFVSMNDCGRFLNMKKPSHFSQYVKSGNRFIKGYQFNTELLKWEIRDFSKEKIKRSDVRPYKKENRTREVSG